MANVREGGSSKARKARTRAAATVLPRHCRRTARQSKTALRAGVSLLTNRHKGKREPHWASRRVCTCLGVRCGLAVGCGRATRSAMLCRTNLRSAGTSHDSDMAAPAAPRRGTRVTIIADDCGYSTPRDDGIVRPEAQAWGEKGHTLARSHDSCAFLDPMSSLLV